MLTKTTITAIRTLIHIGLHADGRSLSVRRIAEHLGESPTYLAKVARDLVKAGILKAHQGVAGGLVLNRAPEAVTLLAIVEACQGTILAEFCQETRTLDGVCAFHVAAAELHKATVQSLSRWTLERLMEQPAPIGPAASDIPCLLQGQFFGAFSRSPTLPPGHLRRLKGSVAGRRRRRIAR